MQIKVSVYLLNWEPEDWFGAKVGKSSSFIEETINTTRQYYRFSNKWKRTLVLRR